MNFSTLFESSFGSFFRIEVIYSDLKSTTKTYFSSRFLETCLEVFDFFQVLTIPFAPMAPFLDSASLNFPSLPYNRRSKLSHILNTIKLSLKI